MPNTFLYSLAGMRACSEQARDLFGSLTPEQLNFCPEPKKWSVGQCLDHIIVSNSTYEATLEALASGTYPRRWYYNRWLAAKSGSWLAESVSPKSKSKMPAPAVFRPSEASDIPATIVGDFIKHNAAFIATLERVAARNEPTVIISSPALSLLTYSVNDMFLMLANHEQRHINQAKRILHLLY